LFDLVNGFDDIIQGGVRPDTQFRARQIVFDAYREANNRMLNAGKFIRSEYSL
jgi:hypothetical protein